MSSDAITKANTELERQPNDAAAWFNKGEAHRLAGDWQSAISSYNQALKIKPGFIEACLALAQALEKTQKTELAIKAYEHWLKIIQSGGGAPLLKTDLATAQKIEQLSADGEKFFLKGQLVEAKKSYESLLALHPNSASALANLAAVYFHMRRFTDAEALLLKALRIRPQHINALNTLGGCFKDTNRVLAAIATYKQCLSIEPNNIITLDNLGKCYIDIKANNLALSTYEKMLEQDPNLAVALARSLHLRRHAGQFENSENLHDRLCHSIRAGGFVEPFIAAVHVPEVLLENTRRWTKQQLPIYAPYDAKRPLPSDGRNDGKLRIGYLSSDLYRHATTSLISEMFERHDRSRFSIYVYSHGRSDSGPERQRVERSADVFRDIAQMTNDNADKLIRSDGIDILVDLKGYTSDHRLSLVSCRPAPLQMHYLGFPGTLGAEFIDYFISDAVTTPDGADAWFQEKLIRLPHSYQINDRKRPLPVSHPRSYYGLPEQGLVFCDFNNAYKITPEVFAVWMRVLKAIPDSVLWLFVTNIHTVMRLRDETAKHGVDVNRLIIGGMMHSAEHLSRYQHVDLFLDATPCSGHTTVSDALWCGVPVVAITGNSFAGRVAAGLLHSVGLPELVTNSLDAYEKKILELAGTPDKLKALRQYLEQGRMTFPLFDSAATTKAIEAAYLQAATLHREGKAPQAFHVAREEA